MKILAGMSIGLAIAGCVVAIARGNTQAAIWSGLVIIWIVNYLIK